MVMLVCSALIFLGFNITRVSHRDVRMRVHSCASARIAHPWTECAHFAIIFAIKLQRCSEFTWEWFACL